MKRQEAIDRCRAIVAAHQNGQLVEGPDRDHVLAVLQGHPEADQKIRPGMQITVGHNAYGTRSFYLLYDDGTRDDFSYHKCRWNGRHRDTPRNNCSP